MNNNEEKRPSIMLYSLREDAVCLKCGHKGAIQAEFKYYPNGIGARARDTYTLQEYENKPYFSPLLGFGGTIPHRCTNCGNVGLIDMGGLEGYSQAFTTARTSQEEN